jgi:hypothetical protein
MDPYSPSLREILFICSTPSLFPLGTRLPRRTATIPWDDELGELSPSRRRFPNWGLLFFVHDASTLNLLRYQVLSRLWLLLKDIPECSRQILTGPNIKLGQSSSKERTKTLALEPLKVIRDA